MIFEYFVILSVTLIIPLIFSFSSKLSFYRKPLRLILSIGIPFFIFIVWDTIAVSRGHWYFNEKYITGLKILNLPLEEILFFIIIPFCGIFSWECVKYFIKNIRRKTA